MKTVLSQLRARPHLSAAVLAGALTVLAVGDRMDWVPRLLTGWNVTVWLYLVQAYWVMSRGDHHHLRRAAIAQAEGATAVLATVIAAAAASVAAIMMELAAAKGTGTASAWPHVLFALATITGSWLLLPTIFALNYASLFHSNEPQDGLEFPGQKKPDAEPPSYWDFLYFSFTIAVAAQTSDVVVSTTQMRRLVLMQSVLSFMFNTTILALMVNIAAGLI